MGIVYKARQRKADRLVALKMILAGGHAGPDELARFRTEAEAIARLQHPHIVQVFEVGEHDGLPFFSLEFCPGGSLDKKLAGTPLPPIKAATLVGKLARGVQAAHKARVLHRDLKPANVLLAADGTPKVTDFGLAKKLDERGVTIPGVIMGTPSYMAPEQACGQGEELGPAVDVYALGAILYECLTGRPPFKAATVLDTLRQVVSEEPVPPRQLNAQVPRDLETVCLKCLQKEAAKRYTSAAALADDLGRFLRGEPTAARPVGAAGRALKWVKRRPAVAAAAALATLAIALAAAGGLWRYQESEEARRSAEERAEWLVYAGQTMQAQRALEDGDASQARRLLGSTRADFRGWEYRYLRSVSDSHRTAHSLGRMTDGSGPDGRGWRIATDGGFGMAVFSPDSRRIACCVGNEVRVFDAEGAKLLLTFSGHTAPIDYLTYSPDGKLIACGARETGKLKIWNASTGQEVRTFEYGYGMGGVIAFHPDGKRVACSNLVQPGRPPPGFVWGP
jgi:hypothetical protein